MTGQASSETHFSVTPSGNDSLHIGVSFYQEKGTVRRNLKELQGREQH